MSTHVQVYRDRISWLAARLSRAPTILGSTDVAAVLGVSPYAGPWDVWSHARTWAPMSAKVARQEAAIREAGAAPDQRRGTFAEPYLLDWYQRKMGVKMDRRIRTIADDAHPWLMVSPDADYRGEDEHVVVEVKTARYSAEWGPDGAVIDRMPTRTYTAPLELVPVYYLTQAAAHLAATGADAVDFVVGLAFHDVRIIRLQRDERYIAWMLETVGEWRERHLIRGEEPPIDGSKGCADHLRTLRAGVGDREATPDEAAHLEAYTVARAEEKAAAARKALAANHLRASLAGSGHSKIWTHGGPSASIGASGALSVKD